MLWDTADLLARCIRDASRPTTDQMTPPEDWYAFLTEAQEEWMDSLSSIAPEALYGAPVRLTSADGGYTYDFPWVNDADHDEGRVEPFGAIEIRATRSGELLYPCPEWSDRGDFTPEMSLIRIPGGRTRQFPNGPYARFITPPGVIDEDHEPVIVPKRVRKLLVYRALAKWARKGGRQDPQPYMDQEHEAWFGNPETGVHGLLGMLRNRFAFQGTDAIPDYTDNSGAWWRGMRTD